MTNTQMTLLARRIITISFIIAFIVLAPATLLYTTGFRYNWQKKKISEVGVLALKTYPANARVHINGQLQKETSPLYLNNLEPNVYAVRAELPGYFSWTKNLEVKSRESTLAYDITLFKQTKPRLLVDGTVNGYSLDRTENYLAVARNGQTIEIFSPAGEKKDMLYSAPKKNLQRVKIFWSANNSYLLIENLDAPEDSLIVPTDGKRPTRLTATLAGGILAQPRFDDTNNEILYGLVGSRLVKIVLNTWRVNVLQTSVQSFAVTPIGVIALRQTAAGTEIIHFTNRLIIRPTEKLETIPPGTYTVLPGSFHNTVALANVAENKILLIDAEDDSRQFLELNGRTGLFGRGAKNEVFLAVGEDEINVFDFAKRQSILLGRYGQTPAAALPLYNLPYYLLYLEGELRITELDDRDKRNTAALISDAAASNISTDGLSTKIFYTTPTGLFMLEIQ